MPALALWLVVSGTGFVFTYADNCTGDWREYNGDCYRLHNYQIQNQNGKSWQDSADVCATEGGVLASARDQGETDFLMGLYGNCDSDWGCYVWLNARLEAGQWVWQDSKTVVSWSPGLPAVQADRDCLRMDAEHGAWGGFPCDSDAQDHICVLAPTTTTVEPNTTTTTTTAKIEGCHTDQECGNGSCVNGTCDYCKPSQCCWGDCESRPSTHPEGTFNFTCVCPPEFGGPFCQLIDDPCRTDPAAVCHNGGLCEPVVRPGHNDWTCVCVDRPPTLGSKKDCSGEPEPTYAIAPELVAVIVVIPVSLIIGVWLLCCVLECLALRELPDLDWTPSTHSASHTEGPAHFGVLSAKPRGFEGGVEDEEDDDDDDDDDVFDDDKANEDNDDNDGDDDVEVHLSSVADVTLSGEERKYQKK